MLFEARPRPRPVSPSGLLSVLWSWPKLSVPIPSVLPPISKWQLKVDAQLALALGGNLDDDGLHENLHARRVEVVDNLLEGLPILRRRADHHRVGRGIGGDIHRIREVDALAGRTGGCADRCLLPLDELRLLSPPPPPPKPPPPLVPPKPPPPLEPPKLALLDRPLLPKPPPIPPKPELPPLAACVEAGAAERSLTGGGREGRRPAAAVEQVVEHLDHLARLRVLEPIDVDSRRGQRRIDVELSNYVLDLAHLERRRQRRSDNWCARRG